MKPEIKNALELVTELCPLDWRGKVDGPLPDGHDNNASLQADQQWLDVAGTLERVGVMALLLAEYIEQRRGGYCGNHNTHDGAAKHVSRLHVKLRRVLGYAMPNAGIVDLR